MNPNQLQLWQISKEIEKQEEVVEQGRQKINKLAQNAAPKPRPK